MKRISPCQHYYQIQLAGCIVLTEGIERSEQGGSLANRNAE
jgi:hypothetical protein